MCSLTKEQFLQLKKFIDICDCAPCGICFKHEQYSGFKGCDCPFSISDKFEEQLILMKNLLKDLDYVHEQN